MKYEETEVSELKGRIIDDLEKEVGICVKKKDRRYDPTQKNKRIPSSEQYKAIVDVMNQYNSI